MSEVKDDIFISDPDPPTPYGLRRDEPVYRIQRIDVLYWITIALAAFMLVWVSNGHDVLP